MDSKKYQTSLGKRASTDSVDERSPKRLSPFVKKEVNKSTVEKNYEFCVLLPNGATVDLKVRSKGGRMPLEEFITKIKQEYSSGIRTLATEKEKRTIDWNSQTLHILGFADKIIPMTLNLESFEPNKCHLLRLKDSLCEVDTYENMWNLTPATDVLRELPEEYTFETALADLIVSINRIMKG